ncbi:MAG: toxin-antitoxin system, antitoxin component [Campylobacterota bacterium]
MEKEYDFSKGVRGKFYKKNAKFQIPIYLEPEIESFFTQLANQQNSNLGQIVNKLLFKDKELIELAK